MEEKFDLPRLMRDSTEKDGNAEIVMDYVVSWCLRFAESKYINERPVLSQYCRYILGKLIGMTITKDLDIESVKVWKEWERIDLTVEVIILKKDAEEKHAILIENKYYSKLHDNQLKRYKDCFIKHYGSDKSWVKHYNLLSCLDTQEEVNKIYGEDIQGTEFVAHAFYDLLDPDCWQKEKGEFKESESDIFNEFWLRW